MEASRKDSFFEDVKAAMERASQKVRSKAAKENRPLVFVKDGKVIKQVPKA